MGTITLSESSSTIRRIGAFVVCLLCSLGLGLSASAQDVLRAINYKAIALPQLIKPRHDANAAVGVIRDSATAQEAAPPWSTTKEVVLHDFSSVLHGAYPSSGVIRDLEGNHYFAQMHRWYHALDEREAAHHDPMPSRPTPLEDPPF